MGSFVLRVKDDPIAGDIQSLNSHLESAKSTICIHVHTVYAKHLSWDIHDLSSL